MLTACLLSGCSLVYSCPARWAACPEKSPHVRLLVVDRLESPSVSFMFILLQPPIHMGATFLPQGTTVEQLQESAPPVWPVSTPVHQSLCRASYGIFWMSPHMSALCFPTSAPISALQVPHMVSTPHVCSVLSWLSASTARTRVIGFITVCWLAAALGMSSLPALQPRPCQRRAPRCPHWLLQHRVSRCLSLGPSLLSVAGVLVILGKSECQFSHCKVKILSLKKLLIKKVTDHVHKMPGMWDTLSMLASYPYLRRYLSLAPRHKNSCSVTSCNSLRQQPPPQEGLPWLFISTGNLTHKVRDFCLLGGGGVYFSLTIVSPAVSTDIE